MAIASRGPAITWYDPLAAASTLLPATGYQGGESVFGRKKDKDAQYEWDPQLGAELERVGALSLPDLAAEVMAKGFNYERPPGDSGVGIDGITDAFSASPQWRVRDSTVHAQVRAAKEAEDPASDRYKWLQLKDIVAEGVQALEKALLVNQTSQFSGVATDIGYVATREGREALQANTVASIVARVTP
jgi:hypothetical protein